MDNQSPLGQYILELCQRQNLSLREASVKSNLAPETISQILRRGRSTKPRSDTLNAIADALGGDFTQMMRLAGHLPPAPTESRLREAEEVTQVLASIPEGPIRDEAIAAIRAIALDARRRASEQEKGH